MGATGDQHEAPTGPPVDADEERRRLLDHAAAAGVDPDEALRVADELAHGMPLAEAYRAVDRRLATGHSLAESEAILVDEEPVTERDVEG